MDGESIQVTRTVAIPVSEIDLRFSRSSGPGGQHAQKSETRVEAIFDVEASSALSPTQKARVIRKAGPVLRAVAQDERSQLRNRELAVERLVESLREALRVPRRRRPTKPTPPRGSAASSRSAAAARRSSYAAGRTTRSRSFVVTVEAAIGRALVDAGAPRMRSGATEDAALGGEARPGGKAVFRQTLRHGSRALRLWPRT